jgi:nucleoside-diphosphate-sugar epimerase
MKVLITGNMGYVGPAVVRHLKSVMPEVEIIGYDSGFFAHCLTTQDELPERQLQRQIFGDVRELPIEVLRSVDAVVHLAAVSNDPMGKRFEATTNEINFSATVDVAKCAKAAGVKNFVFASSCSVYGFADGGPRRETDAVNPLTAYARSKVAAERALSQLNCGDMAVTCLRFATACGMSDRLRLDLVLNDFVASAFNCEKIALRSDGTAWRPLIDVEDMARAIEWAALRSASQGGRYLVVNAGSSEWNYRIGDLARAVAAEIPGTAIEVAKHAAADSRSYQVDFSEYRSLAPDHQPRMTLAATVRRLLDGLRAVGFADPNFRSSYAARLQVLDDHIRSGRLTPELRWTPQIRDSAREPLASCLLAGASPSSC